jgi:hypothetical protein
VAHVHAAASVLQIGDALVRLAIARHVTKRAETSSGVKLPRLVPLRSA